MSNYNESTGYCPKQEEEYTVGVNRAATRPLGFNLPEYSLTLKHCPYSQENGCEYLATECPIITTERKEVEMIIDSGMLENSFFTG